MSEGSGRRDRIERLASAALLLATALGLAVRVVSIAEPLGIDQSLWASAVRGMSEGQRLYTDVWEQRPPGIYLTYLLAFNLFGWNTAAVAWLDIAASTITVVLLWLIGRRLDGPLAGAIAAALYSVFTIPAGLYGYGGFLERSVCETFIVACIAAAAWCATPLRTRDGLAAAAGVGLFCGIAAIFKPNAALYFPALMVWIVCYRPATGGRLRGAWPLVAAAAGAATVPAIATVVWLWQQGTLADARVAVLDFNRHYVAAGFEPGAYAIAFKDAVGLLVKTSPVWLAGSVASLAALWRLARARTLPPLAGLALLWGAATVCVVVVNGARLFNSYFLQAFAPLALMAAWFFAGALRNPSRAATALRSATAAAMVVVVARYGYGRRTFAWTAGNVAALTGQLDSTSHLERFGGYANERGYSARANQELADYVRSHTGPGDRIFLFGANGAGVYFLADRLTAHRFLRVNFFYPDDFPHPDFTLTTVTRDLTGRRPTYVIFENMHTRSAFGRAVSGIVDDPRVHALLAAYDQEAVIEDFTLFRLRE